MPPPENSGSPNLCASRLRVVATSLLVICSGCAVAAWVWWNLPNETSRAAFAGREPAPATVIPKVVSPTNVNPTADAVPETTVADTEPVVPEPPLPAPAAPPVLNQDEQYRQLIVGDWEDEYRGKRHLNVRPDGTATMVVEPDPLGRALFAAKLTFDITWSLKDGRVEMITHGGQPEGKVKLILRLYGNRTLQQIVTLDNSQMLILDPDGETKYNWKRPSTQPSDGHPPDASNGETGDSPCA